MKKSISLCSLLLVVCSYTCPPALRAVAPSAQESKATSTTLRLAGLRDRVTVRRDERGVPYIEASNDDDLYFAQGYITASDRLWQMDLLRRNVRGELAEVLGPGALSQDQRHRTLGFSRIVDATAAKMTPRMRAVLEAYARGVNAFIASRTSQNLPPEFVILQYKPSPWVPADSLAVGKLIYEVLSTTWQYDIMRAALGHLPKEKRDAIWPETTPLDVLVVGRDRAKRSQKQSAPTISPPSASALAELSDIIATQQRSFHLAGFMNNDATQASNNWVVSGKRTASGKPLLANDPHLPAFAPNIWYLTELVAPGVHVAGVTFPGAPGIVLGHNEQIAWGATNMGPDVQDLYLEKFDKEKPTRYLTPSGWREAEVRQEKIKVRKGFADASTETQTFTVTVTRHGPIVLDKEGARYALRWPALDSNSVEFEGLFLANQARNWKEFTAALARYTGPTQNFIYADVRGHIGYYGAGRIPIRRSGDGSVPYDGSTDAGDWTSFIPFDKLPHLYDPPAGFIVTANQRVVGNDYPYFLTHIWAQPYRARRIYDSLVLNKKLTATDFRRILGDTYSIAGVTFARETVRIMRGQTMDDKMRDALAAFAAWDGRVDADSRAAPLVAQMRIAFRQHVMRGALGDQLYKDLAGVSADVLVDRVITQQPREWLPAKFSSYADLLRTSFADARQVLTKNLGADESKWTWGAMSPARFTHPLATAPFIGAQFTIAPFPQNGTGSLLGSTVNVGAGVSMRLIADPGNWDRTQHGLALGQSGLPTSPHWSDQLADWRAVTPRAFPFSAAAIARATRETIILEPAR